MPGSDRHTARDVTRSIPGRATSITLLALVLALTYTGFAAAQTERVYPRTANIYLHGWVDPSRFERLARWDLLILNTVWSEADLAQLRALRPDIKLFLYVCAYCVEWPRDATDPWEQENIAYATAHDLWWYDSQREPASDWPGSRMVNITDAGAAGPRGAWRAFIAEQVESLVAARPSLDGIMLDNFWRGISWNQPALQLDSDCNPTHNPTGCDGPDGAASLDSLWNQALRGLAGDLRARFDRLETGRGRSLALVGNGTADYHPWINGSIHEGFPTTAQRTDPGNPYNYSWNREMFDPASGYLVAPFNNDPYAVDIVNSEWTGTIDAPTRAGDFERHKRFTFVSALLGDGYYSLDAGAVRGKGVLWWEPEYDHGGRGPGYLGRARGSMYRVPGVLGPEQITNGSFGDDLRAWQTHPFGATGSVRIDPQAFHTEPSAARIEVQAIEPGGELKVWQRNLPVEEGEGYTLRLWARASPPQPLYFQVYGETCPRGSCLEERVAHLETTWQEYTVSFVSPGTAESALNLFVRDTGTVWIDDVSLRTGESSFYRRDFENGVVLLNYTGEARTVELGTTYRRLNLPGNNVFDGAAVSRETVPAWDAQILLRTNVAPTPSRRGELYQNEPNPFNPATRIRFELLQPEHVRLAVYDARGRLVRVLLDRPLPAGDSHSVSWDGADRFARPVRSGTYIYRIDTPSFNDSRKMTLLH